MVDNPNVLCEGCGKRTRCRYIRQRKDFVDLVHGQKVVRNVDDSGWLCWRCARRLKG